MTDPERDPRDELPLKATQFQILLVLLDSEMHGYAIVKAVEAVDGRRLEAANLYRTLRGMLARGWVEESERRPDPEIDDHRRRYFRISRRGRAIAGAEAKRLAGLVDAARRRRLLPRPEQAL